MTYPFAIFHQYSDRSNKPEMIYVGIDKAAAFDALWKFLVDGETTNGDGLYMYSAPTHFMDSNESNDEKP